MGIAFLTLKQRLQTLIGDSGGTYAHLYDDAINNAARELYPVLFKPLVDETVTTEKNKRLYELPSDFQGGVLSQAWIRTSETSPYHYYEIFGWSIEDDEGTRYLKIPSLLSADKTFKLIGYCPLESDLDSDSDTMTIDDKYTPRLLTYAAYLLYQMVEGIPASDDVSRYERASYKWQVRSEMLKSRRMSKPQGVIHWSL